MHSIRHYRQDPAFRVNVGILHDRRVQWFTEATAFFAVSLPHYAHTTLNSEEHDMAWPVPRLPSSTFQNILALETEPRTSP